MKIKTWVICSIGEFDLVEAKTKEDAIAQCQFCSEDIEYVLEILTARKYTLDWKEECIS